MLENRMVIDSEWEWQEDKRRVVYECSDCGGDIREDDEYYSVDGKNYCMECMNDRKHYA